MDCKSDTSLTQLSAGNIAPHLTIGHLPTVQPLPTIRDPEWLKVEVCREFQRGMCKRTDDCRYAHPDKHMQVTEGKVIACFDALKGRCNRESCKYLHPTHLIKQHLEFAGRQTLINNRAMLQQMLPHNTTGVVQNTTALPIGGSLVSYEPVGASNAQQITSLHAASMYGQQLAAAAANPAAAAAASYSVLQPSAAQAALYNPSLLNQHVLPVYQLPQTAGQPHLTFAHPAHHHNAASNVAAMLPSANGARADKLEVCRDFQRGNCTRGEFDCRYGHPQDRSMIDPTDNTVTVCMDFIKGRCTREKCKYFHPPPHLQAKIRAAQNPTGASLLQSLAAPAAIGSPQPVMLSNGNPLGQPPMKRQVMDSNLISSSGGASGLPAPSPIVSHSGTAPGSLAALYGYSGLLPQTMQAANPTAYYQQDYVEVKDDKVTVCRDALQGVCVRPQCKFYHFPSSSTNKLLVDPIYSHMSLHHHAAAAAPQAPQHHSNLLGAGATFAPAPQDLMSAAVASAAPDSGNLQHQQQQSGTFTSAGPFIGMLDSNAGGSSIGASSALPSQSAHQGFTLANGGAPI